MVKTLIDNPKLMNKETLYELRSLVAAYPYYQTARLLMLQNLYLLHDPTFDDELRRAALFLNDRTKLFELVEAKHHKLEASEDYTPDTSFHTITESSTHQVLDAQIHESSAAPTASRSERSATLINRFLNQIPEESAQSTNNKPTAADATIDYVSYLLRSESSEESATSGISLIDDFLNQGGRISLPEITAEEEKAIVDAIKLVEANETEDFITTETQIKTTQKTTGNDTISEDLAQKHIKQGNYLAAKDIILQLNLNNSEKSIYFADQIRFLDKLITLTKDTKTQEKNTP